MSARRPAVFIGSSSEGKRYAEYLQAALDDDCDATVWDQGVFGLSGSTLHALVATAQQVDFAILILTPDDVRQSRGSDAPCARDNVIFEAGLFVGALGRERTFFVHAKDLELNLPTDLAGITTCTFRSQRHDENLRAAVNTAALRIREAMTLLGARTPEVEPSKRSVIDERVELVSELDALTSNVESQGWSVKTRTESVYRVSSRAGTDHYLDLGAPRDTRVKLRTFARELAKEGLQVDPALLLAVDSVPPTG
jgi:hypothetical protein